MTPRPLPTPSPGDEPAWVRRHLGHLVAEPPDEIAASPSFRGGQQAADAALAAFDVTGYARDRNEVWPQGRRGASRLSPYIRHGLLTLREVWDRVAEGPPRDVAKFRDELLWQEYARHLYARLGPRLSRPLRAEPATLPPASGQAEQPWNRQMACVDLAVGELTEHGWMVNQTRMWLASQWTVRHGWDWREGEDAFFTHLLDGSRAANRLGWQWTVGTGSGRPYGFSRSQVMRRAPGVCDGCALRATCPIEHWPDVAEPVPVDRPARLRRDDDPEATGGPRSPDPASADRQPPSIVWLTAESLGDDDPALAAHPHLPAVFVWDEALLARLRLSGKRLVFLAETLADLSVRRHVTTYLGDPVDVLTDAGAAVTFAPVPGFRARARRVRPSIVHPYPWLVRPDAGPVTSFTAWRRHLRV